MVYDLYGVVGIIFILVAWLPETLKNLRSSHVNIRMEFLILYTLGSLLLTFHAFLVSDLVFIILNSLATLLSGANIILKVFRNSK
ncbi:MAG: hypothetical protein ACP6IP_06115 [Candidatus Njordarchaeia archaeon]